MRYIIIALLTLMVLGTNTQVYGMRPGETPQDAAQRVTMGGD